MLETRPNKPKSLYILTKRVYTGTQQPILTLLLFWNAAIEICDGLFGMLFPLPIFLHYFLSTQIFLI